MELPMDDVRILSIGNRQSKFINRSFC